MSLATLPWRRETSVSRKSDRPFYSLQREMNRLFDDFFNEADFFPTWATTSGPLSDFNPAVDVSEDEKVYKVRAELPGLEERDVEISVNDNILTLKGHKEYSDEEQREDYMRVERAQGYFFRSIPFPLQVDENKIKAKMKNGILTIDLPKAPSATAKSKKISIEKG